MLAQPLPKRLDIRKMARKEVIFKGEIPLQSFPRLQEVLEDDSGDLQYELQVEVEQGGHIVLRGSLSASVKVLCQRCLKAMPYELNTELALGIVRNDEAAQHLPRELDPWVVPEDEVDPREALEEEVLLSIPSANFHPQNECEGLSSYQAGDVSDYEQQAKAQKENPFAELEKLKQ